MEMFGCCVSCTCDKFVFLLVSLACNTRLCPLENYLQMFLQTFFKLFFKVSSSFVLDFKLNLFAHRHHSFSFRLTFDIPLPLICSLDTSVSISMESDIAFCIDLTLVIPQTVPAVRSSLVHGCIYAASY